MDKLEDAKKIMDKDKEKVMLLSFEPAEREMLRDIAARCMNVIFRDVQKMNLGDPVKSTLAYYSIIVMLKDSLESTMKELGIHDLEFVKKER